MRLQCFSSLLIIASGLPSAEAMTLYDPKLCYILDGVLCLYGIIITGMFINERFFKSKVRVMDDRIYSDLQGAHSDAYSSLKRGGDPERGRNRRMNDNQGIYSDLNKDRNDEYRELPMKKERHRKNEGVYQGLSSASRDTYNTLQMQPLSSR